MTAFVIIEFEIGDEDYVDTLNSNFAALAANAVHKDDLATLVNDLIVLGGDPADIGVLQLNNGSLPEGYVAGRRVGTAPGASLEGIDLNLALYQANVMAYQDAHTRF